MNPKTILQDMGLAEQEADIYLTLLKLGGASASNTARAAGIKRTTIYAILRTLAQRGFVSVYYRRGKRIYHAEKPNRIRRYFERKLVTFDNLVPVLESLDKTVLQVSSLRFIETMAELKRFYLDIIDEYRGYKKKEYCVIGSTEAWQGHEPEFFQDFRRKRAAAYIKTKLILSAESKPINPVDPTLLREIKYLPRKYAFKSTIDIFKDKILIVSPELSSLAVVIQVPVMVDVFKAIFEILWEILQEKQKQAY